MSDTKTDENITIIIPKETQEKFPQLVADIQKSKSMDTKEMNYWLQVLPIMTEEQIDELKDILSTEKNKLEEIEKKYSSKLTTPPEKTKEEIAKEEAIRKKKREEQKEKERLARASENVDDILSQLDFA